MLILVFLMFVSNICCYLVLMLCWLFRLHISLRYVILCFIKQVMKKSLQSKWRHGLVRKSRLVERLLSWWTNYLFIHSYILCNIFSYCIVYSNDKNKYVTTFKSYKFVSVYLHFMGSKCKYKYLKKIPVLFYLCRSLIFDNNYEVTLINLEITIRAQRIAGGWKA